MRPAFVILGKDLRQRLRDRSALLVAIVVPLVLASIFGLIFHNAIGGRISFSSGWSIRITGRQRKHSAPTR
jgi:ABC-type Na+ efflux pump permease subunit